MNIFTDIGIIDLLRIQPPFAIPYQFSGGGGGIGRPIDFFAPIPRGDEPTSGSVGRPDESSSQIGRASDQ